MSTLGVLFDSTLFLAVPKRLSLRRDGASDPSYYLEKLPTDFDGSKASDSHRLKLHFEPTFEKSNMGAVLVVVVVVGEQNKQYSLIHL